LWKGFIGDFLRFLQNTAIPFWQNATFDQMQMKLHHEKMDLFNHPDELFPYDDRSKRIERYA
jgi:hypothetical protein